jgi:uncharacterized protein
MLKAFSERGAQVEKHHWAEVRLAALLHDVGHGPFSHGSERVYESFPEYASFFDRIQSERPDLFEGCAPHEILGYLIITSDQFRDLFRQICMLYDSQTSFCDLHSINLDRIGAMILGKLPEGKPSDKYLTQIINGPFDVDKIDYLHRDGYHTGLKTGIDIERLFLTLEVIWWNNERVLSVDLSGATVLEQLLFNKSVLFSSVYHHHKIRSSLCAVISLFKLVRDNSWNIAGHDFSSPLDFLRIDEADILNTNHLDISRTAQNGALNDYVLRIKNRRFLKRALVLAPISVEGDSSFGEIAKFENNLERIGEVENEIAKGLPEIGSSPKCIYVDFPERPRFRKTARESMVRISAKDRVPLEDVYPTRGWVVGYAQFRFRAYVFCPPGHEGKVGKIAYEVLAQKGIRVSEKAFELAKQSDSMIHQVFHFT